MYGLAWIVFVVGQYQPVGITVQQGLTAFCPDIYTVPKSGLTSFKIKPTDIMPPEFKSGLWGLPEKDNNDNYELFSKIKTLLYLKWVLITLKGTLKASYLDVFRRQHAEFFFSNVWIMSFGQNVEIGVECQMIAVVMFSY